MLQMTASDRIGQDLMRAVCTVVTPGSISGWGSFEDPVIDQRLASTEGTVVLALHVMTTMVIQASTRLGHLSPWSSISHFIYLDHVEENIYRRVGVGRFFEPEIIDNLNNTEPLDIQLI